MLISDILYELRRNPTQNPKISVNDYLVNYLKYAANLPNSTIKNLFVSFVEIPKLGINPRSIYNTPIGIYCYPVEYVIQMTTKYNEPDSRLPMIRLPFAGDKPYAAIFSAKSNANIVNLKTITETEVNYYMDKLDNVISPFISKTFYSSSTEYIAKVKERSNREARVKSNGGKFWYMVMDIADTIKSNRKTPVVWTELYRTMGIDGFVDPDTGIIHPYEPYQAVFFNRTKLNVLDIVNNKYSPEQYTTRKLSGEVIHTKFKNNMQFMRNVVNIIQGESDNLQISTLYSSLASFLNSLYSDAPKYYRRLPKDIRLNLIKKHPNVFRNVHSVATKEEFVTMFLMNPRLISLVDSIKPYLTKEEFTVVFDRVLSNINARPLPYEDKKQLSIDIFELLDSEMFLPDTELFRFLIELYPLIWHKIYNVYGYEDVEKSIYEYALSELKRHNYPYENIEELESMIYNSY